VQKHETTNALNWFLICPAHGHELLLNTSLESYQASKQAPKVSVLGRKCLKLS